MVKRKKFFVLPATCNLFSKCGKFFFEKLVNDRWKIPWKICNKYLKIYCVQILWKLQKPKKIAFNRFVQSITIGSCPLICWRYILFPFEMINCPIKSLKSSHFLYTAGDNGLCPYSSYISQETTLTHTQLNQLIFGQIILHNASQHWSSLI